MLERVRNEDAPERPVSERQAIVEVAAHDPQSVRSTFSHVGEREVDANRVPAQPLEIDAGPATDVEDAAPEKIGLQQAE
jgi:hypothetical protein